MHKRYVPIVVTIAVLLAVAIVGYSQPPVVQKSPTRVLMVNNGGRVFFTHAIHADDYGYDCADCHHDGVEGAEPIACGSCHPKAFDGLFKEVHQRAFPSKEYCERCHDSEPVSSMSDDERPDSDMLLTRADAFHGQCMDCHKAEDAGPYGEESCSTCHAK
ncbi:cytochrome c3 family protein [Desulfovibrio ferrophilus]|uniref:Class III cytochrome C domain-containing protein n=1 Tax=Desulfovibrio ferrophilus TaxID=241368 RepID=A0A2Z6AVY4_9BACT|nr:cytochrome c3 family protein [Desulfovibrio ferrophilus]BBD07378.1 uncharacterized protein DFE_0652 [Desulfovibrio ferrophilus]